MPTYDYVCDQCGYEFELFHSMKDEPVKICPECNAAKVRRLIGTGGGIIFKGSGFYETDYKRKSGSGSSSSSSSESKSSSSAKKDSAKTEPVKTESTKSESKETKSKNGKEAA